MNAKKEYRRITSLVECREDSTAKKKLVGHATTWGTRYMIGDPKYWGWSEAFMPGAFDESLRRKDDVVALWNHNDSDLLGRVASGTLSLSDDGIGLLSVIDPPDTSLGRDIMTLTARGDVRQMSLAFSVVEEAWRILDDGTEERDIIKADLYDVSPVTNPANSATDFSLRAGTQALLEQRKFQSVSAKLRNQKLRLLELTK